MNSIVLLEDSDNNNPTAQSPNSEEKCPVDSLRPEGGYNNSIDISWGFALMVHTYLHIPSLDVRQNKNILTIGVIHNIF